MRGRRSRQRGSDRKKQSTSMPDKEETSLGEHASIDSKLQTHTIALVVSVLGVLVVLGVSLSLVLRHTQKNAQGMVVEIEKLIKRLSENERMAKDQSEIVKLLAQHATALQERVLSVESQMQQLNGSNQMHGSDLKDLKREYIDTKNKLDQANEEIKKHSDKLGALNRQHKELSTTLAKKEVEMTSAIGTLDKRMGALEESHDGTNANVRDELQQLKNSQIQLRQQAAGQVQGLLALLSQVEIQRQQLEKQLKESKQMRGDLERLLANSSKKDVGYRQAKRQLDKASEDIKKHSDELGALNRQHEELSTKIGYVDKRMVALAESNAGTNMNVHKKIQELDKLQNSTERRVGILVSGVNSQIGQINEQIFKLAGRLHTHPLPNVLQGDPPRTFVHRRLSDNSEHSDNSGDAGDWYPEEYPNTTQYIPTQALKPHRH